MKIRNPVVPPYCETGLQGTGYRNSSFDRSVESSEGPSPDSGVTTLLRQRQSENGQVETSPTKKRPRVCIMSDVTKGTRMSRVVLVVGRGSRDSSTDSRRSLSERVSFLVSDTPCRLSVQEHGWTRVSEFKKKGFVYADVWCSSETDKQPST